MAAILSLGETSQMKQSVFARIVDSGDDSLFDIHTKAPGPQGSLPLTPEMLLTRPSG
jgi:hypothetical protein